MSRILCLILMTAISYSRLTKGEESPDSSSEAENASEESAEDVAATPSASTPTTDSSSNRSSLNCPEKPLKKATARKLAGRLFAEARSAYTDEDYLIALEKFLCSMKVVEHENTVTNIQKTAEEIEEKAAALALIEAYLASASENELNRKIEKIASPFAQAVAEEEQAAREAAEAAAEAEATAPECPEIELTPPTYQQNDNARRFLMISGWSEIGVGSAIFIAAIILQATASAAKNDAANANRYETYLEKKEKYRVLQVGATGMFISGIVIASVGVTHLYLSKRTANGDALSRGKRAMPVTVVTGPRWFGFEGRF